MRTLALPLIAAVLSIPPALAQAELSPASFAVVPARMDLALGQITAAASGAPPVSPQEAPDKKAWRRSLIAVAASQSLDAISSWGMRELNPLLASADGRFGGRAVSIKLGATAAIAFAEYLVVKKYPRAARVFSRVNWSSAALTTGIALHNFAVR